MPQSIISFDKSILCEQHSVFYQVIVIGKSVPPICSFEYGISHVAHSVG